MIRTVTYYDPESGVVLSSGTTTAPDLVCPKGARILFDIEACPGKDMVINTSVVPRPVLNTQVIGNQLIGVPAGAVLEIEGVEYSADGTPIEMLFDLPGEYMIKIKAPPYLDAEILYESKAYV